MVWVVIGLIGFVLPTSVANLYKLGAPLPAYSAEIAIIWPQRVVPAFMNVRENRIVRWGFTGAAAFWIAAGLLFGFLSRRVTSFLWLIPLVVVFVSIVLGLLELMPPQLGFRLYGEGP